MWKSYRQTIFFLLKFFGVYFLGSWLYSAYLDAYAPSPDWFTIKLADVSTYLLNFFEPSFNQISADLPICSVFCNNEQVIAVIEGCNAISIYILFLAFIIAFKAPLKQYLFFIPLGFILLQLANVFRIVWLGVLYARKSTYAESIHDYLFPAIIYGTVVLLWIFWINRIKHAKEVA